MIKKIKFQWVFEISILTICCILFLLPSLKYATIHNALFIAEESNYYHLSLISWMFYNTTRQHKNYWFRTVHTKSFVYSALLIHSLPFSLAEKLTYAENIYKPPPFVSKDTLTGIQGMKYLSVFLCFLAMLAIYFSMRSILNIKTALVTTFLWAINPLILERAGMLRVHEFATLFYVLSWFFIVKGFNEQKRKFWILGGVACGLSYLTFSTGLFIFPITVITFILLRIFKKKVDFKKFSFFLIFSVLVASPFLIKNMVFFGNPIFDENLFNAAFWPENPTTEEMANETNVYGYHFIRKYFTTHAISDMIEREVKGMDRLLVGLANYFWPLYFLFIFGILVSKGKGKWYSFVYLTILMLLLAWWAHKQPRKYFLILPFIFGYSIFFIDKVCFWLPDILIKLIKKIKKVLMKFYDGLLKPKFPETKKSLKYVKYIICIMALCGFFIIIALIAPHAHLLMDFFESRVLGERLKPNELFNVTMRPIVSRLNQLNNEIDIEIPLDFSVSEGFSANILKTDIVSDGKILKSINYIGVIINGGKKSMEFMYSIPTEWVDGSRNFVFINSFKIKEVKFGEIWGTKEIDSTFVSGNITLTMAGGQEIRILEN